MNNIKIDYLPTKIAEVVREIFSSEQITEYFAYLSYEGWYELINSHNKMTDELKKEFFILMVK